nr:hypothetical protein CFP56_73758 [Quercus suber]
MPPRPILPPQMESDWNAEIIRNYLTSQPGDGSSNFFRTIFRWDFYTYGYARDLAMDALAREKLVPRAGAKLPRKSEFRYRGRILAEMALQNSYPQIFTPSHLTDPTQRPAWYIPGLLACDRTGDEEFESLVNMFLAHSWSKTRQKTKRGDVGESRHERQSPCTEPPMSSRRRPSADGTEPPMSSRRRPSAPSAAATTSGVEPRMKASRNSSDRSHEARAESDALLDTLLTIMRRGKKEDTIVNLVNITVLNDKAMTLDVEPLLLGELLSSDHSVRWDWFWSTFHSRLRGCGLFYFPASRAVPITTSTHFRGAIALLSTSVDTSSNCGDITFFIAESIEHVRLVPTDRRVARFEDIGATTISLDYGIDSAHQEAHLFRESLRKGLACSSTGSGSRCRSRDWPPAALALDSDAGLETGLQQHWLWIAMQASRLASSSRPLAMPAMLLAATRRTRTGTCRSLAMPLRLRALSIDGADATAVRVTGKLIKPLRLLRRPANLDTVVLSTKSRRDARPTAVELKVSCHSHLYLGAKSVVGIHT